MGTRNACGVCVDLQAGKSLNTSFLLEPILLWAHDSPCWLYRYIFTYFPTSHWEWIRVCQSFPTHSTVSLISMIINSVKCVKLGEKKKEWTSILLSTWGSCRLSRQLGMAWLTHPGWIWDSRQAYWTADYFSVAWMRPRRCKEFCVSKCCLKGQSLFKWQVKVHSESSV